MKAPDKIYLSVEKGEDWAYAMWTQKNPEEQKFSELDEHEEYIRKDALIEWAEKKKNDVKKFGQRYNEANYYNSGCHDTIQELIDKINELWQRQKNGHWRRIQKK